jgi:hypothetical protein
MSRLSAFYRGQETDTEGRSLEEIWSWDDDSLEAVHDFIQWLFPLPERSRFNPHAPLLTEDDIASFKKDHVLRANLRKSFARILSFLGLTLAEHDQVVEGQNFGTRAPDMWSAPNHNWLRITRILRSLTLLGLQVEAQALFRWLETTYRSGKFSIDAETYAYWKNAVQV